MSKSELNILRFLHGEASPEEMKKLQKWTAKSPDNESGLQIAQTIFTEAGALSNHRRVDANAEWEAFQQLTQKTKTASQVTDVDLLHYIDGTADYALRKKINNWGLEAAVNQKEINNLTAINTAISGLADYKSVDINSEYAKLKSKTQAPQAGKIIPVVTTSQAAPQETTPTPGPTPVIKRASVIPMWMKYAAAACVGTIMAASLYLWNPAPKTLTYATSDSPEQVLLSDGTSVDLGPNSTLTYFADFEKVKTREVDLQGTGLFSVRSMADKPFTAATNNMVGVTVLGTVFEVQSSPDYQSVISTIEGQVKAFDVKDPSVSTIVNAGESVGFSKDGFAEIIEEVIVPDTRQEYSVIQVLDHLMENSNWKVTSGPSQSFKLNSKIMVDLDQSYIEIIEYLKTAGYLDYRKRSCEGCYEITSFIGE